jgi:tRNA (cmo5U34)-methyltransferase
MNATPGTPTTPTATPAESPPGVDAPPQQVNAGVVSDEHFDPVTYAQWVRAEIPQYDALQGAIAAATAGRAASTILDLGTGTGETLSRVLALHPDAHVVGVDVSAPMLNAARSRLAPYDVRLQLADLLEALPVGPFDLVISALAVHHLDGPGKATLFTRVAAALRPGGRFVLGDVILPGDTASAAIALTDDWDKPSTVAEQLGWLDDAGLEVAVVWQEGDLALFTADRPVS